MLKPYEGKLVDALDTINLDERKITIVATVYNDSQDFIFTKEYKLPKKTFTKVVASEYEDKLDNMLCNKELELNESCIMYECRKFSDFYSLSDFLY